MVRVLVGEEDGIELLRSDAESGELFRDAFGTKAGVYQDACVGGFDEGAVARASACEDREMEHE
jgi:hypothetical protein